ncbi:Cys/Met metabolism pyridoxal-phosphate-dependent protein [Fictibacillus macauensis ZFHKF-1]|uniref:homocysteine desulfhydrase n=1 Tax=Fictibacillus macauensis ZFHKF-1 TaxID=1196324 RepID=I8UBS5_9BACL|nr:aminotransferase class I/II-fold pyridoxal phosphate-dependent enzyme [Fictibacillus macauensis]EIT84395.1 Cys/Met metabolism pyridoxal-phosphate-dependent protein [Fictibacillus macauensis ZFHKF-1]
MKKQQFDTKTVHFGNNRSQSPVSKVQPIYQTTAYTFKDLEDLESYYSGEHDFLYSRINHPNSDDLGAGVAALEGAEDGVATSSGLAAILAAVVAIVKSGEHIVACNDLYGGTRHLFAHELQSFGIEVTFVSFTEEAAIKAAIQPNTKLLYSESITNPLLRVENIEKMVATAKEHKLLTMIDNTFATPYVLQPLRSGVDMIVHSATKYIGGHSDVTAGVVVGAHEHIARVKEKVANLGCQMGPFDAWLACRGLKTLSIRMERQISNAQQLATFLQGHTSVKTVYYPTNVSEKGAGAIVTIELQPLVSIHAFFKHLSWIKIVATLAGVETSVSYPIGTSHRSLPAEVAASLGITKNVVRISVGIEDIEDIKEAFKEALDLASAE